MKRFHLTPILAAAMAAALAADAGAKPIDLQMGARAYGMGGAFAAIADDATAAYWNPAGLTRLQDITFSETNWYLQEVDAVNVNYFAAVIPVSDIGTIAGGWLLQHATLEEGTGATFRETGWNEHSFSLAAGRRLWENLAGFRQTSVGFSLNRHVINSGGGNGTGLGFDLGAWTAFPYGISLGLVARSVATDMMGDKIDPEYRLGLGYTWQNANNRVVVALDAASKENVWYEGSVDGVDLNAKGFGGLEYTFMMPEWHGSIRLGGNKPLISQHSNVNLSGGLGFGYSGFNLEYAYHTGTKEQVTLGQSHRVTLELQLGKIMEMTGTGAGKSPR